MLRLHALLVLLVAFACVLAAPAPQPATLPMRPRTNAEALQRGLPLLKPRFCDAACQAHRLAHRAKPSRTSIPDVSVQFRKTCTDVTFDFSLGATMAGTCDDSNGVQHQSTLNLNSCIGVNKGTLTCNPGGFTTTGGCVNCSVNGETLECLCPDSKGKLSPASLNLNACIGNEEGQLYCNKHTDH